MNDSPITAHWAFFFRSLVLRAPLPFVGGSIVGAASPSIAGRGVAAHGWLEAPSLSRGGAYGLNYANESFNESIISHAPSQEAATLHTALHSNGSPLLGGQRARSAPCAAAHRRRKKRGALRTLTPCAGGLGGLLRLLSITRCRGWGHRAGSLTYTPHLPSTLPPPQQTGAGLRRLGPWRAEPNP